MKILNIIKRNIWLFSSAHLTFLEQLNIFINKMIHYATKYYFMLQAILLRGDKKLIVNYKKDLNKKIETKKALLVFFRFPIYKKHYVSRMKFYFSNNGLVINIIKALNELGYTVDIIDSDYTSYSSKSKYDLIMVHNIYDEKIVNDNLFSGGKFIYFDTGAYWRTHIEKITERFDYFRARHVLNVKKMKQDFFQKLHTNGQLADALFKKTDGIIVIGDTIAKSYDIFPNVYKVINGVYQDKYYTKNKTEIDLKNGKNNFLYFGGGLNNFSKGLDILLDVFIQNKDKHLYVCSEFENVLQDTYKLDKYPNIHIVGYLKQGSRYFYNIIEKCNYVIQPSCNEGVPGGVLDCMQYGLIPLVTPECNIDIKNFGITLPSYKVEDISVAIKKISMENINSLLQRSRETKKEIKNHFSEKIFLETMKKYISIIINT